MKNVIINIRKKNACMEGLMQLSAKSVYVCVGGGGGGGSIM